MIIHYQNELMIMSSHLVSTMFGGIDGDLQPATLINSGAPAIVTSGQDQMACGYVPQKVL